MSIEQQFQQAARLIAAFERGSAPDDALVFSACFQLAALIRPRLPSIYAMPDEEQYVAAVSALLSELAAQDLVVSSLIQTLVGDAPPPPPHARRAPTSITVSPAHTIIQGNQYNLSGDFRGAIVTVASTLDGVIQQVQAASLAPASQAELSRLLGMLQQVLHQTPAAYAQDAIALASSAHMVATVALDSQSRSELPSFVAAFEQSAVRLREVLPELRAPAADFVAAIQQVAQ